MRLVMGSESILDLDEARRRLQQMDREHADVLQLVAKLREVHRSLESQARLLEDRAESAEERLTRLRVLVRALRNRGIRLQSAADQAIADLEKERQRVAHACDSLRSSLEQHHAQWCSEQRALVETAAQQQASEMATIARAWEQQSGQLRDELATLRDEMRRRLESMSGDWKQHLAAVTASCETRLQTQVSNTSREVGQDLVSVRHEVQSLLDRRTYVAAAAIGLSLVLGVYGLMGRTSPSAADDHRVDRETRTERVADALPPQSPTSAGNEQQAATSPTPETPAVLERNAQATAQEPSSAERGIDRQTSPFPASAATTPQESPLAGEAELSADPPSDPLPGTRVWTDHKGRSAEAEFEDFRDGTVYLRSPGTGRVHPIPLEQLSVPDQAYVRGLLAWRR